jgi:hypothetical protein
MRALAAELYAGSDLMIWPLLTLVLFIAIFVLAVGRLIRRGAAAYDEVARIPLDDGAAPARREQEQQ